MADTQTTVKARENAMTSLSLQQSCFNHSRREAVARCPLCSRFFCRECVTEHEGRMLCTTCLSGLVRSTPKTRRPWRIWLSSLLQGGFGLLLLWIVFYLIGRLLLAIPHSFHEGTIWQSHWWEKP